MSNKNESDSKKYFNKENILLACIPVIGSIIIAFITLPDKKSEPQPVSIPISNILELRIKAGKINDDVVYGRYNDFLPIMSEGLKPIVTQNVFNNAKIAIVDSVGHFIKALDTTHSVISGNYIFYVKNQHDKGISVNHIAFDQEGKVIGLYSIPYR